MNTETFNPDHVRSAAKLIKELSGIDILPVRVKQIVTLKAGSANPVHFDLNTLEPKDRLIVRLMASVEALAMDCQIQKLAYRGDAIKVAGHVMTAQEVFDDAMREVGE